MSSVWQVIQDYWLIFLIGSYPRGPLGGLAATVALIVLGLGLRVSLRNSSRSG